MAVVPKTILFTTLSAINNDTLYTAPTNQGTTVKKVVFHNTHTSNVAVSFIYKSARIFWYDLKPNETVEWTDPLHLNKGDTVGCSVGVVGKVNLLIWGLELS